MTLTAGMATMMPPGAGGRILDFRRRGTPPRRRRRSVLLALVKPLLAAFAVVAVPVGLAAWVLTAPLFRLREVEVGAIAGRVYGRVPAGSVRQALAPLAGENLVRLSLAAAAG